MHNSKSDVTGTCCTAVCDSIGLEGTAIKLNRGLDLYQETLVVIINPVLLFELKMLQALHRAA